MTSRELCRELVVAKERMTAQHERDATLAWQIANLTRAKELPRLKDLIGKRQTLEEQRAIWDQAAQVFGGAVRSRPHNKRRVRIIRMPARESA